MTGKKGKGFEYVQQNTRKRCTARRTARVFPSFGRQNAGVLSRTTNTGNHLLWPQAGACIPKRRVVVSTASAHGRGNHHVHKTGCQTSGGSPSHTTTLRWSSCACS